MSAEEQVTAHFRNDNFLAGFYWLEGPAMTPKNPSLQEIGRRQFLQITNFEDLTLGLVQTPGADKNVMNSKARIVMAVDFRLFMTGYGKWIGRK